MKFRVEVTAVNNQKRYLDLEGEDEIDIAVQLVQELEQNETYKKNRYTFEHTSPKRDGDRVILRTKTGQQEFATVEEAEAEADKLDPKDGYDILSLEQPVGSRHTVVIKHRPSVEAQEV